MVRIAAANFLVVEDIENASANLLSKTPGRLPANINVDALSKNVVRLMNTMAGSDGEVPAYTPPSLSKAVQTWLNDVNSRKDSTSAETGSVSTQPDDEVTELAERLARLAIRCLYHFELDEEMTDAPSSAPSSASSSASSSAPSSTPKSASDGVSEEADIEMRDAPSAKRETHTANPNADMDVEMT